MQIFFRTWKNDHNSLVFIHPETICSKHFLWFGIHFFFQFGPDFLKLGTEFLKFGILTFFLNFGTDFLELGPDFLEFGTDFVESGTDFLRFETDFFESGTDFLEFGTILQTKRVCRSRWCKCLSILLIWFPFQLSFLSKPRLTDFELPYIVRLFLTEVICV